jgi:hypothetical protein
VDGEKATRLLQRMEGDPAANLDMIAKLKEEVCLYGQHLQSKQNQRTGFEAYKQHAFSTPTNCVIVMDFKENFKIGGGPVETASSFYRKKQISLLGFAVHYRDGTGNPAIKYFDYLSKILSHDSLFVHECVAKLLDEPFMRRFQQFHFWSDSGPHFRSTEMMYAWCCRFSKDRPECIFTANFFNEYHGKSLVDGHFGLLARWLLEVETQRDVRNIEELKAAFEEKVAEGVARLGEGRSVDAIFRIYTRTSPRSVIKKLKLEDFKVNMSFAFFDGQLYRSVWSTLDENTYTRTDLVEYIVSDTRKTKYAPERSIGTTEVPLVMGQGSRKTLRKRMELAGADAQEAMQVARQTATFTGVAPMELD